MTVLYPVRFVAEHQFSGDPDATWYGTTVLTKAKLNKDIIDFKILNAAVGPYDLELLTFTVDAFMPDGTSEEVMIIGEALLSGIFQDSVEVRWVSSLVEPD